MKTTLEIPDPTFRKAKAKAAELGIPLRAYITQAVEEELSVGNLSVGKLSVGKLSVGKQRSGARPWLECSGELAHLHKETRRIQKIIDDEFGQIEPENWI